MSNKTYTQANIQEDILFWLFGVELGYIDCSINSMEDLANAVDSHHTKEEIEEIVSKQMYY